MSDNLIKVRFPSIIQSRLGVESEISVNAHSVHELIEKLGEKDERLKVCVLHRTIGIFVKEENIRSLQNLDTPLQSGDEVIIISMVHGG